MIHKDVVRVLTHLHHDVKKCPKGLRNGQVYQLAKSEERILLTQDKDFSDTKRYPPSEMKGIICIRVFPPTIAHVLERIKKFVQETGPENTEGKLIILE